MNEGDKFICQYPNWFNAFGEIQVVLDVGQRMTLTRKRMIGGAMFLYFKETPEDTCFLATGFKPLRNLN